MSNLNQNINNDNRGLIAISFGGTNSNTKISTTSLQEENNLLNYRSGDQEFWGNMLVFTIYAIYLLGLVSYLIFSFSVWKISKKLFEDHPWISWIPVLQWYQFIKICGKKWYWVLFTPLLFIAINVVVNIIFGTISTNIMRNSGSNMIYLLGSITLIVQYFSFAIALLPLHLSLSKRLNRGVGTAILTSLFGIIMYPYLAISSDPEHMGNAGNSSTMNFGNIGVTPLEPKKEEVRVDITPQTDPTLNSEMPVSLSQNPGNPETKI